MKKTNKTVYLLLIVLLSYAECYGQSITPDFTDVFLQDEVASIHINIPQESIDFILDSDNLYSNEEFEANFIYSSSALTDTVENVGFRLRGNTSRMADKKSFKVSFNTFSSGARWNGLKKLNLNGEHNDVSILRSKLCWDFLRQMGLSSSRTSFIKLYINDEYKGVYLNVEHINDDYVNSRYTEGSGNLYKCIYPADLQYEGASISNYTSLGYEQNTNTWSDDSFQDLTDFISILNQTSDDDLFCQLPEVLNVREYIRHLAAEILIGHWDGYSFNKNNYYLYQNKSQGRFEWIPYDLDNTLGIDWFNMSWSERNIYEWHNNSRPLASRILDNSEWRELFSYEVEQMIENYFNSEVISTEIDQWQNLLESHVADDLYYTYDYGFNITDFLAAGNNSWGNHVDQGILDYVGTRVSNALDQLEDYDLPKGIFYVTDSSPILDQTSIIVTAECSDSFSADVRLHYSFDSGNWQEVSMNSENDGIYAGTIALDDTSEMLSYFVSYEVNDYSMEYPCTPRMIPLTKNLNGLVINELMAKNLSVISDEQGSYEDWLELYNGGELMWLGNFFLTDDITFPNKWSLPNFTFNENDHVLLWCDNDPEEGPLHTNFKLSTSGEQLFLFSSFEDGYQLIDEISYPELSADVSYGRSSDGSDQWVEFPASTPNASNLIVSIEESTLNQPHSVYPNPTSDHIWLSHPTPWILLDLKGNQVLTGSGINIDTSTISSGVYLLKTTENSYRVIKL